MRESLVHSRMRLLARAHAFKPVRHVFRGQVVNAHRRKACFARQEHKLRFSFLVDVSIVFVRPFLFDQLITRTALAADVDQTRFLSHVARKTGGVIAKAGRITYQKALRILEQRLERIGRLTPVFPGENASVRHN